MSHQFKILQPWIPQILSDIKRDLRTEHLAKSPQFYKAHFGNRPLNRLTNEEIFSVYEKELLQGDDENLKTWVINRWVFHHGEIYEQFASSLSQIHPDFTAIQQLSEEESKKILETAIPAFGVLDTYLFSVLNEVVFPPSIFSAMRAQTESLASMAEAPIEENWQERYERDITRIQKKCEDRVSGVMKKYATDVEALKKQIRALQQQLSAR